MSGLRRPRRWAAATVAAAGALLFLAGCSRDAGSTPGSTAARLGSPAEVSRAAGSWYLFSGGMPSAVRAPAAAGSGKFAPWTVQTRGAGMLSIAGRLYLAVNGWGVVELTLPASGAEPRFRGFENRALFGGRTINGLSSDGKQILINLYRNTVFPTRAPRSSPVAYVRFEPSGGGLTPVALPLTLKGWETAAVVHTSEGGWAIEWKKTTSKRVEFRYSLYDPHTRQNATIDRDAFLKAYDFIPVSKAPPAVRRVAGIALAEAYAPEGGRSEVMHLLLRRTPYERVERYREGPEKLLESGDARLVIIPAVRADNRVFALVSRGRLLESGRMNTADAGVQAQLPALPSGFVYTDFWTDGRSLVVTWEEQRFTEVGAAGIYVTTLGSLSWSAVR